MQNTQNIEHCGQDGKSLIKSLLGHNVHIYLLWTPWVTTCITLSVSQRFNLQLGYSVRPFLLQMAASPVMQCSHYGLTGVPWNIPVQHFNPIAYQTQRRKMYKATRCCFIQLFNSFGQPHVRVFRLVWSASSIPQLVWHM